MLKISILNKPTKRAYVAEIFTNILPSHNKLSCNSCKCDPAVINCCDCIFNSNTYSLKELQCDNRIIEGLDSTKLLKVNLGIKEDNMVYAIQVDDEDVELKCYNIDCGQFKCEDCILRKDNLFSLKDLIYLGRVIEEEVK